MYIYIYCRIYIKVLTQVVKAVRQWICRSEPEPLKSAPGSVWSQSLSIIRFNALVQRGWGGGVFTPHNTTKQAL